MKHVPREEGETDTKVGHEGHVFSPLEMLFADSYPGDDVFCDG